MAMEVWPSLETHLPFGHHFPLNHDYERKSRELFQGKFRVILRFLFLKGDHTDLNYPWFSHGIIDIARDIGGINPPTSRMRQSLPVNVCLLPSLKLT